MEELNFEWDAKKSRSNEIKRGVSFEEARTAFFDENARLIEDLIRIISARKADPSERLEYARYLP
jgi:uncharacterized DUF497 family protein